MSRMFSFYLRCAHLIVAAMFCFAGIAVPAWGQFETRATNPLPEGAYSIATGDFNHDGKLDVVIIDNNGLSVSLGKGDGTFQKPVLYSTELSYSLAVGDFNNDGNLDIVVANENLNPSTVSVYLGNGDGTFKAPVDSSTTNYNEFVAVGDFNGDGKLDIVLIENPSISVLLGNGDGTFQPPNDNNSFVGAQWLAVGDFNNDHKLDVIAIGSFGSSYNIGVFLGNGDGTLQNSLTYPIDYVPGTVAVGDLNSDGNLDAVVAYDLAGVGVLLGKGDGSFQPAVNYNTTGIGSYYVIVSDLNVDGKLDVSLPTGSGVDVLWGNGDGTLQPAQLFTTSETGIPAVGDLNGDHLPDFVMASTLYGATTMLNTGDVTFSSSAPRVFPVQLVNTTSASQTVRLTNSGTANLSISSIKVTGEFQMSNNCGSSVAAGAHCTINLAFRPKSVGAHTGLITLVDSASSKPMFIELSGSGTIVKVSVGSLAFGSQKVGTKSKSQVVTATNEGSTALQFANVFIGGKDPHDFSETDSCTSQAIQPGASCTVTVTFDPTKAGARSGTLNFVPQGTTGPQPVTLTGTGT
jgi:hypothetical protein